MCLLSVYGNLNHLEAKQIEKEMVINRGFIYSSNKWEKVETAWKFMQRNLLEHFFGKFTSNSHLHPSHDSYMNLNDDFTRVRLEMQRKLNKVFPQALNLVKNFTIVQ